MREKKRNAGRQLFGVKVNTAARVHAWFYKQDVVNVEACPGLFSFVDRQFGGDHIELARVVRPF